jgi:hypothetical protein
MNMTYEQQSARITELERELAEVKAKIRCARGCTIVNTTKYPIGVNRYAVKSTYDIYPIIESGNYKLIPDDESTPATAPEGGKR